MGVHVLMAQRKDGSQISTDIMAFAPYIGLKGDSFVSDWGVHL